MCFHIIKYVYSNHRTRISVRHFVGVFIYAGTINRPLRLRTVCQNIADGLPFCGYIHIRGRDKSAPTAADGLPKHCKRIAITLRTPTKLVANIPPGVGADSSCPYPDVTKNVYFHNQICVFTLLNMWLI